MIAIEDVIRIHRVLVDQFGGTHGLRDKSALESAISRPFATFDQQEMYPSPLDKAAAILESLVTNHPFIDGNKRIGYVLARLLILKSGLDIHATQQDKYDLVLGVSKGELKYDNIKFWLSERCK
jgi:death on curing protein